MVKTILVDYERHQSERIENWNQYDLIKENEQQSKWRTKGLKQCL